MNHILDGTDLTDIDLGPHQEHIDKHGIRRDVMVLDQLGAMNALADMAEPNLNIVGVDICTILSNACDGDLSNLPWLKHFDAVTLRNFLRNSTHQPDACAICGTHFGIARLPVRFISIWPIQEGGGARDGLTLGVCSKCAIRPTFMWADVLAVADRLEQWLVRISTSDWEEI
jgi:hypothetical protein